MTKFAHISDIHFRGLSRHKEYTSAFERLFEKLKVIKPDIVFLGGDLFHTKTSGISPEVIDRLAWMLKGFAEIATTYIILGNHDAALANSSREDVISPIVKAMNDDRIVLCKESNSYELACQASVVLHVFSCVDKENWNKVIPSKNTLNIAAFHGSVGGTKLDNGWILPDSKAEVKLSMFKDFDFAFLGDIHCQSFLSERPDKNGTMKPWIGYPGSLIQQNHGEQGPKGFLVWDIKNKDDWDVQFVELENLQPFVTVPWVDSSVEATLEALQSQQRLLPGARYRISSDMPLTPLLARSIEQSLRHRGVEEVTFKSDNKLSFDSLETPGGHLVKKVSLRNHSDVVFGLYKEFLKQNSKKFSLKEEELVEAEKYISEYLKKSNALEQDITRDVNWSIKSFEFDNLYRYGPGNKIVFENLEGIIGILGKNKIGKSSLIGALMYVLFNGSDREGVSKNGQVMNQNKTSCSGKIVITVNGTDYLIQRSSTRAEIPKKKTKTEFDAEKTETKLFFAKLNSDGSVLEELNGISRDETDKNIRKLIGSPQDFLMTSVATQSRMERFIDEGATSRKAILNRFLDLDLFDKLFGFVKENVSGLNLQATRYSTNWKDSIEALENSLSVNEKEREILNLEILQTREKFNEIRSWIAVNESADLIEASESLVKVQQELFLLQKQFDRNETEFNQLLSTLEKLRNQISVLEKEKNETDIVYLHQKIEELKELEQKLLKTSLEQKDNERLLSSQEKSIKKLSLVPCGDQFPSCLYIKDSHEDKSYVEAQRQKVSEVSEVLQGLLNSVQIYQAEKFTERMNHYVSIQQNLKDLNKEITEKQTRLELFEKTKKDLVSRINLTKKRKEELSLKVLQQDTEILEQKKKELQEIQTTIFSQERQRNNLLVQYGKDKTSLEQLEKDRKDSEVLLTKLRVLESIQAAFHKNGIPSIVLQTQLPALNLELSRLLGGLVDFGITFEAEAGSSVMDIFIEDGHSKRILELGSGMEKVIASIAIRVALINLSTLPKANLLVMDESFNGCDSEHVQKCLQLLQLLKEDFKTILIISHMQEVKEASDSIIEVMSTGQDSKILA